MKVDSFAASDCGRQRQTNEDRYFIDESLGLYIVCDGMGGQAAGEIAAERSVALTSEYIRKRRDVLTSAANSPDGYYRVMELAEEATQEASRRLFTLAGSDAEWAGMGTTMTVLVVVETKGIMAHVGDSRLYLLRSKQLHQLSTDHTLANELVQNESFACAEPIVDQYRHVLTRTIGQQELVQVETLLFDLFPGDTCLLCSDGLSNYFDDHQTVCQFLEKDDLSSVPADLIQFANSQGGADNITLIVLRLPTGTDDTTANEVQHQFEILKSTFLCKKLSTSRLMRVLNICSMVECAAGQELLADGQAIEGLYVLLDGKLSLDDECQISTQLSPGDCFGAACLLKPGNAHGSVLAMEPSRLLFLPRKEFAKLTGRLPKLGNALLRNLGKHLSESLDSVRFNIDTIDEGIG